LVDVHAQRENVAAIGREFDRMPIRSRQGRQARDLIETDEVEGAANRGRYSVAWNFLLRLGGCA
jgi:hypothetical protein